MWIITIWPCSFSSSFKYVKPIFCRLRMALNITGFNLSTNSESLFLPLFSSRDHSIELWVNCYLEFPQSQGFFGIWRVWGVCTWPNQQGSCMALSEGITVRNIISIVHILTLLTLCYLTQAQSHDTSSEVQTLLCKK